MGADHSNSVVRLRLTNFCLYFVILLYFCISCICSLKSVVSGDRSDRTAAAAARVPAKLLGEEPLHHLAISLNWKSKSQMNFWQQTNPTGEQDWTAIKHLHASLPPCELTSQPRLDDVRWPEGTTCYIDPVLLKAGLCTSKMISRCTLWPVQ